MRTKTLAIHSIQKNMLGTSVHNNIIKVLLNTGKTLTIKTPDSYEANKINNKLHYYPSEGQQHNSFDLEYEIELDFFVEF